MRRLFEELKALKRAIAATGLFLCSVSAVYSQGDMRFFGTATKDKKPLSGATVSIYRGSDKIAELVTGKNGKFKYTFDLGFEYKLKFFYPGCVEMYMVMNLRVPSDKMDIYPDYAIEFPFFDSNNKDLNLAKFKQPFTKVIYDGDDGFYDDPNYRFYEGLYIDKVALAKAEAEKKAKLEAEAKARADLEARIAAERRLREEKARIEAELRARAEAEELERMKAEELARLKAEAEKEKDAKTKETMESEIIRLEREREAKAALEKKNREIKSKYENDLLKLVAENERIERAQEFSKKKEEARANSVIETMRRQAELKAKADPLREREKQQVKKQRVNHQLQIQQVNALLEAAAFADRSVRISSQIDLPSPGEYKPPKAKPNVAVTNTSEMMKDILSTTITYEGKLTAYRKETWFWGSVYYFRNDTEIDLATYEKELSAYIKIK